MKCLRLQYCDFLKMEIVEKAVGNVDYLRLFIMPCNTHLSINDKNILTFDLCSSIILLRRGKKLETLLERKKNYDERIFN